MIVGVDISSFRVDTAWLEDGRPRRWHQVLGKPREPLIDRLRRIHIEWPSDAVSEVVIEMPYATQKNAISALMAVAGIVTHQAPAWARVAWPSAGELRAAIGAKNTKDSAQVAIRSHFHFGDIPYHSNLIDWDEHELDALIACIGWTRILEQQDAA